MVPRPSTPSRRWRRVGLGVAVAMVPALFAWLAWQSINSRKPPPAAPAAGAVGAVALPTASEAWALVQSQYCLRCHGMEQTHVGPGFAQIAQRYRDDPSAPAQLAERIQHGSAGRWGRRLMPRQPGIGPGQAQALAAWVLAQPDPAATAR